MIEDYSIWRINALDISLVKISDAGTDANTVIGSYITCFTFNNKFIAVRRLNVPQGYRQEDILQMDFDKAKYFLIDANSDEIYGPYESVKDFDAQCQKLKVGDLGEWIDTYPAPEGAKF